MSAKRRRCGEAASLRPNPSGRQPGARSAHGSAMRRIGEPEGSGDDRHDAATGRRAREGRKPAEFCWFLQHRPGRLGRRDVARAGQGDDADPREGGTRDRPGGCIGGGGGVGWGARRGHVEGLTTPAPRSAAQPPVASLSPKSDGPVVQGQDVLPLLSPDAMRPPGRPTPPPIRRRCPGTGSRSQGSHPAGDEMGDGLDRPPRPRSGRRPRAWTQAARALSGDAVEGVARRGAGQAAPGGPPIGCPRRTGKRGREAVAEGSAATSPEARENVARGCPGGTRPCLGGRGLPGSRARRGEEEQTHARRAPPRGGSGEEGRGPGPRPLLSTGGRRRSREAITPAPTSLAQRREGGMDLRRNGLDRSPRLRDGHPPPACAAAAPTAGHYRLSGDAVEGAARRGAGQAATSPEAGENVARGCPGGTRPWREGRRSQGGREGGGRRSKPMHDAPPRGGIG